MKPILTQEDLGKTEALLRRSERDRVAAFVKSLAPVVETAWLAAEIAAGRHWESPLTPPSNWTCPYCGRTQVKHRDWELAAADHIDACKKRPSIQCPTCWMVSYNVNDIEQRYCGNCHKFHDWIKP